MLELSMLILTLLMFLTGCAVVPVAIVGGAAVGAYKLSGREGADGFLKDWKLHTKVQERWKAESLIELPILVYESKVMICGYFGNDLTKHIEAINKDARKVIDATHKTDVTVKDMIKDKMLHAKISTSMIANQMINSRNYKIRIIDGVVYLLGTAYNQAEKDECIRFLNQFEDIQRIESDIEIIPGKTSSLMPK